MAPLSVDAVEVDRRYFDFNVDVYKALDVPLLLLTDVVTHSDAPTGRPSDVSTVAVPINVVALLFSIAVADSLSDWASGEVHVTVLVRFRTAVQ